MQKPLSLNKYKRWLDELCHTLYSSPARICECMPAYSGLFKPLMNSKGQLNRKEYPNVAVPCETIWLLNDFISQIGSIYDGVIDLFDPNLRYQYDAIHALLSAERNVITAMNFRNRYESNEIFMLDFQCEAFNLENMQNIILKDYLGDETRQRLLREFLENPERFYQKGADMLAATVRGVSGRYDPARNLQGAVVDESDGIGF